MDGEIAFVDDDSLHRKRAIVEVTSGKSNKKHFDAFMNHAKNADIGLYIVLHKPTKGMIADAKMVGTYHSLGWQQEYPRVQILEIDDLLHGKKPLLPPPYKKRGKSTSFD